MAYHNFQADLGNSAPPAPAPSQQTPDPDWARGFDAFMAEQQPTFIPDASNAGYGSVAPCGPTYGLYPGGMTQWQQISVPTWCDNNGIYVSDMPQQLFPVQFNAGYAATAPPAPMNGLYNNGMQQFALPDNAGYVAPGSTGVTPPTPAARLYPGGMQHFPPPVNATPAPVGPLNPLDPIYRRQIQYEANGRPIKPAGGHRDPLYPAYRREYKNWHQNGHRRSQTGRRR